MRVVIHVLVKHSVWITEYESRKRFVLSISFAIINRFTCCRKKHSINQYIIRRNRSMLTFKSFCQNISHLPWFSKNRFKTTGTVCPSIFVAWSNRSNSLLHKVNILLFYLFKSFHLTKILWRLNKNWPLTLFPHLLVCEMKILVEFNPYFFSFQYKVLIDGITLK